MFGADSPEAQQLAADSARLRSTTTRLRDYVGLGVHCAKGSAFCANATGVKFGQTTPTHTAAPDLLPNEPGGYNGYQALFGSKYVAPVLGAGTPNLTHDGVPVTNAAGNLTDLFGNEIDGAFATPAPVSPATATSTPRSRWPTPPTCWSTASRSSTCTWLTSTATTSSRGLQHGTCDSAPDALGSGSQCYLDQAAYYNKAFGVFFQRLAQDGITPKNTLFVFSSDEGDHEAGANVGRAIQPTPAELQRRHRSSAPTRRAPSASWTATSRACSPARTGNTTPYSMEADTAPEFYLTGNPGPDTPVVRTFEHDVAGLTASTRIRTRPTSRSPTTWRTRSRKAILHMVNADPARTPTLAMFAKPDYYLLQRRPLGCPCKGQLICQTNGFAWDHGDYAAEINTNFLGIVGPGVKNLGLDGPAARRRAPPRREPTAARSRCRQPLPRSVDRRDRHQADHDVPGRAAGRLRARRAGHHPDPERPELRAQRAGVTKLGECYKQLNSSVGEFGAATLQASTNAIESTSAGDSTFTGVDGQLRALDVARDQLAGHDQGRAGGGGLPGRADPRCRRPDRRLPGR